MSGSCNVAARSEAAQRFARLSGGDYSYRGPFECYFRRLSYVRALEDVVQGLMTRAFAPGATCTEVVSDLRGLALAVREIKWGHVADEIDRLADCLDTAKVSRIGVRGARRGATFDSVLSKVRRERWTALRDSMITRHAVSLELPADWCSREGAERYLWPLTEPVHEVRTMSGIFIRAGDAVSADAGQKMRSLIEALHAGEGAFEQVCPGMTSEVRAAREALDQWGTPAALAAGVPRLVAAWGGGSDKLKALLRNAEAKHRQIEGKAKVRPPTTAEVVEALNAAHEISRDEWIDQGTVARALGIEPRSVRDLKQQPGFPDAMKDGRRKMYSVLALARWAHESGRMIRLEALPQSVRSSLAERLSSPRESVPEGHAYQEGLRKSRTRRHGPS